MLVPGDGVAVGIDNGGTTNNGTVLTSDGRFLVDTMAELPSLVREGPDKAIQALVDEFDKVLGMTGVPREKVLAVGLDTPGPAGTSSTSGARSRRASASLSCTTTTPTRPRFTPTTCGTARSRAAAAQWPPSSAPDSAAAWSRRGVSSRARPGWPASSGTCRYRWRDCSRTASPGRRATAGCSPTPSRSPR